MSALSDSVDHVGELTIECRVEYGTTQDEPHVIELCVDDVIELNDLRISFWVLNPTEHPLVSARMGEVYVRPYTLVICRVVNLCVNVNIDIVIVGNIVHTSLTLPDRKSSITKVLAVLVGVVVGHSTQEVPVLVLSLKLSHRVGRQVPYPVTITILRLVCQIRLTPLLIND